MSKLQTTILCLASYEKGDSLLKELKQSGCRVILLTAESLRDTPFWPREAIDELLFMPDLAKQPDVTYAVSYLARTRKIDRIIPLDEFDIEVAASLREHLRIPGMGETTARLFRDKLAMRVQARDKGILVPAFTPVVNYDDLREFMERVPPPWVLKPRTSASAIGIRKIMDEEELWRTLDEIGDEQSFKVLEKYLPGEIYHIDSIVADNEVRFAQAHKYGTPPFNVMHDGGIFTTHTLERGSAEELELQDINRRLMDAFGLRRGVTHTEFIRGAHDGRFYFLETAARVGGAYINDMIKASSGIDLWKEWARVEVAACGDTFYSPPSANDDHAGIILSLARQEEPDTSAYNDPEIVYRVHKRHHAGLVLASRRQDRVVDLLQSYTVRFYEDFHASAPPPDKPTA